jgi:phosphoserine phosphatase RsbU/P
VKAPDRVGDDTLTAVLRTAQYLALLRDHGDIWRELGQVLVRFFAADLVALLERRPDGMIASRYCTWTDTAACDRLTALDGTVREVIDSGFLATERLGLPGGQYAVAVLPLAADHHTTTALLVGHLTSEPLPQALLDVYLAVAGLFESTIARLASERAAIENARRFEEQRRIATALQENLVSPLPRVEGLATGLVVQTAFAPELVGGDFSDVFLLDDSLVAVLIGDVAGKGIRAAGLTERVRSVVRAFSTIDTSPAFILRKTNQLLLRRETPREFVTAFLLVLDMRTGSTTYASAGHPPPVLYEESGCRPLTMSFGVPLGSFNRDYVDHHVTLATGQGLVLYTDGVTEARHDGGLFGEDRLLSTVSDLREHGPQEVADGLREAVIAFAGRLSDDLEVLVLRLVPTSG